MERANRALLTIVIQRLSAAARATFAPQLPEASEATSTHRVAEGRPGTDAPSDLARAVTPFVTDMHRVMGELAAHAAEVRAARGALSQLSDLRSPFLMVGGDPMLAAEVRSKCAFVSGAAQSVEAAIAAATRTLQSLAAAVGNIAQPAIEDAVLAGRVEQMNQRIQTAAPELSQGTGQIEEIEVFITRVALHSNLQALGTVLDAARDADAGNTFVIAATETQALATQADHLTAAVLRFADGIIVAAQQARTALSHAEAVIHGLDQAVGAIADDMARRKAALPATPQQRAAG
ncbi:MAG: hypothetical protein C0471_11100 [Erythrobacter sp.]|nr:hypothetical protein [Erythrobacter sp.]